MTTEAEELADRIAVANSAALVGLDVDLLTRDDLLRLMHSATVRGISIGAEYMSAKLTASVCVRIAALASRKPHEPRQQ